MELSNYNPISLEQPVAVKSFVKESPLPSSDAPTLGKSSLLNNLLREDKAIVTDIAGTTRDVIEEYVNINGVPLKLIDTAGIREI